MSATTAKSTGTIYLAETAEQIARCFPVMHELRPHLNAEEFLMQVERQRAKGYELAYVEEAGEVQALAGFRTGEFLAWGLIMYVDDLVTTEGTRSKGHGGLLIDWLAARARKLGCKQLHLDSGVQRFAAHRFYLRHRMEISSHHFSLVL